jgi:glycosyltransferase involved in cell wall biosynthesis
MPCYNAAATLPETLDSLAAQTHPNFEIVAVDDGSTDGTRDILHERAAREPRLRVLAFEHAGIIPALNAGLDACRGAYVARMDADDLCDPERLSKQANYLDANPEVGLVAAWVAGFPEDELRQGFRIYIDWLNSLVTDAEIKRELFVESPFAHPSVMYRKPLVGDLGGYQEHDWPEDYDLWLRMAAGGVTFAKIPELLVRWRDHPTRLTRSDSRYSVKNFLRAKAHYLARGPLAGRDAVIVWGSGMMGRRLGKRLLDEAVPVVAFVDIDPRKIGRTRQGKPIISADDFMAWWGRYQQPALLAAVGARGARELIRQQVNGFGLAEGQDWWAAA